MTYSGDVTVGGPADTRELPGLTVTKVAVGSFDNNVYLLRCPDTGDVLMVDAAAEPDRILREATAGGGRLARIVETHQHADHWGALKDVLARTDVPVAAGQKDIDGFGGVAIDEVLSDGDTVRVGNATLQVIHLEGHTPGGVALLYDAGGRLADAPHLFSGDSLFPGGPGNTFGNPDAFAHLMDDLERKVFGPLPDDTWVYPGHGKDTTLGVERPAVPEWRARGW